MSSDVKKRSEKKEFHTMIVLAKKAADGSIHQQLLLYPNDLRFVALLQHLRYLCFIHTMNTGASSRIKTVCKSPRCDR